MGKIRNIRFVGYDGKYPNLCSGTLTLEIEGKEEKFKYCISSGGSCHFDDEWNPTIHNGAWSVMYEEPVEDECTLGYVNKDVKFTFEEIKYIEFLVNDNVPQGCCGGCL